MKNICEEKNSSFMVVILPAMTMPYILAVMQNFNEYPFLHSHAQLDDFLTAQKIWHIDIMPFFMNRAVMPLVVSKFDPHFNKEGNRIVAQAIFENLKKYINN